MFLNHIIGNLPAWFQIYDLFIRNQTVRFRKSGFYFAGSYCITNFTPRDEAPVRDRN